MKATTNTFEQNFDAIIKLTALWGLAESGLGGIMFAFKIPFTGFFIGAIAVIILSLIAKFSNYSFKEIISCTFIVIIIKASASPHSPLPAYFAVLFQGILAAFLFSTFRSHKLACILLGIISMAESAMQKIITLTFFFGKNIWDAVDNLVNEIAKIFSVPAQHNYSLWMISIYVFIYIVWGLIVGVFAYRLPLSIQQQRANVLGIYETLPSQFNSAVQISKSLKRKRKLMYYSIIWISIIGVFIFSGVDNKKIVTLILRTTAAVLLLLLLVRPVFKYLFSKWLSKRSDLELKRSRQVIELLPALKSFVPDAYVISKSENGIFNRLKTFSLTILILTLYATKRE